MTDPTQPGLDELVERLWKWANIYATENGGFLPGDTIFAEAASTISTLKAELEGVRSANASPSPLDAARHSSEQGKWVLVPREPTEEMVIAGQVAIPALPHFERRSERRDPETGRLVVRDQPWAYAAAAYRAMLSAAPASPAAREGE